MSELTVCAAYYASDGSSWLQEGDDLNQIDVFSDPYRIVCTTSEVLDELTLSLPHSFAVPFADCLTRTLPHSPSRSLAVSFTHRLVHSPFRSPSRSLTVSFTRCLVHSLSERKSCEQRNIRESNNSEHNCRVTPSDSSSFSLFRFGALYRSEWGRVSEVA